MTDHFTEAQARAAILDQRIKKPAGAATEVVVQHGILHALLAIADQLEGIRELIETSTDGGPPVGKVADLKSFTEPPGLDAFG